MSYATLFFVVQLEPAIPKKDVVSNMMQRMGYKGFGLGKDEQGISTALTIKKVGKVGGVIVNQSNERKYVA
jgi:splicing factor 45